MPLTGVSTVTVTASYRLGDGSPASGVVKFSPSVRLHDDADEIVVPLPVEVVLVNGEFSVELPATDDPTVEPSGWSWDVDEQITNARRLYSILLPESLGPIVDLSELAPVDPLVPGAVYTLVEDLPTDEEVLAAIEAHRVDTTDVHGIADTAALVRTNDARLADPRTPSGAAGGVLSGTFPSPGFAVDMATQAELDAEATARAAAVTAEATARAAGDTALDARLDDVEVALPAKADLVGGFVPDGQIPAGITRDAELAAAISAALDAVLGGAPGALDTLNELAAAIGDDADFAGTVTALLAGKAATDGSNVVPATWRTVLGLGTSATRNVGTGAGTVAAGDDARLADTRTPTDGTVTTAKLVDANVTTPKIADAAVTIAKLSFDPATQAELDAEATARAAAVTAAKAGGMGVVNHGAVAGTARPAGYGAVHWVGSVEPTNAVDGDVWTNTA